MGSANNDRWSSTGITGLFPQVRYYFNGCIGLENNHFFLFSIKERRNISESHLQKPFVIPKITRYRGNWLSLPHRKEWVFQNFQEIKEHHEKPAAQLFYPTPIQLISVVLYCHAVSNEMFRSMIIEKEQSNKKDLTMSWALRSACSMFPDATLNPPFHCKIRWAHASRLSWAEGGAFKESLQTRWRAVSFLALRLFGFPCKSVKNILETHLY